MRILFGNEWLLDVKAFQNEIKLGQKMLLSNKYINTFFIDKVTESYTLINDILGERYTACKANLNNDNLLFRNEDIEDIRKIKIILHQQSLLLQEFKLNIEIEEMLIGLKSFKEIEKKYPFNGYLLIELIDKNYLTVLIDLQNKLNNKLNYLYL
jgi:hypothetical protein